MQPPEGETQLHRLAGLRGRDGKKRKACLSQWTAHGFGLGSAEREEGQSVCGRQKVGEPVRWSKARMQYFMTNIKARLGSEGGFIL